MRVSDEKQLLECVGVGFASGLPELEADLVLRHHAPVLCRQARSSAQQCAVQRARPNTSKNSAIDPKPQTPNTKP
jgi:hypothetical protein